MSFYTSYVGANSPDEERNPKQCEEPLFRERYEGLHERVCGGVDPPGTHSYSSAHSQYQSEIVLEQMPRPL